MTLMATAEVVSQKQIDPASVVVNATIVAVPVNNIAVYAGDTVNLARQVEIITGWKFLYNGIRDRNLINQGAPGTFYGLPIYSGTDIDSKGEFDRRTESLVASFTANDIIIAIGGNVSVAFHGATLHLEAALTRLIEEAHHQSLKAA